MAKTAGKKKITPCEICGGPRRGPKAHKPDCPNNPANKPSGPKRSRGDGFSVASLRGLDVEQLMSVRGQIDTLIAGKAPELKEKIARLQATLDAIEEK